MLRLVRVMCLVTLVACGKSEPEPKHKAGATCGESAATMMRIGLEAKGHAIPKDMPERARVALAATIEAITDHCTDDTWSRDAIECFGGALAIGDIKPCSELLTHEQDAAMNKAIKDVIAGRYISKAKQQR